MTTHAAPTGPSIMEGLRLMAATFSAFEIVAMKRDQEKRLNRARLTAAAEPRTITAGGAPA